MTTQKVEVVDEVMLNFLRVGCLTSDKSFHLCADLHHDEDPGTFTTAAGCARGRTICPRPCTPRPSSSPYTPYACGAQLALLLVAVGVMNIHDVRDRRQTASSLNAPA